MPTRPFPPARPGRRIGGIPIQILLRAGAAAGLTALVVVVAGPALLASTLTSADPWIVAAALVVVQIQILGSAWRWRFTAGRLGLALPFGRASAEYYLGSLLNMVLPGGVAGDVLRTARMARADDGPATLRLSLRSVVLERLAGQIAFVVMAAGGVALAFAEGATLPRGGPGVVAAGGFGIAGLGAVAGLLVRFGPPWLRAALDDLGGDIRRAWLGRGAYLVQGVVSLALAASYVAVFALAALAIDRPLPTIGITVMVPLVLLSMVLPVSIGGWGLREGSAALLWPLMGLAAVDGAATAALYGIIVTLGALPGIVVLLRRPKRAAAASPVEPGVKVAGSPGA